MLSLERNPTAATALAALLLLAGPGLAQTGGGRTPPPPAPDIVLFHYTGGPQPPNVVVIGSHPGNVEFGVPRSRLFDAASPLDGTLADTPGGGAHTFPGPDDPNDTGMLVKLGGYSQDPQDPCADSVTVCIEIWIPPTPPTYRWIKCTTMHAGAYSYSPEALLVVQSGRRNYYHKQSRRIAKGTTALSPDEADPADHLAREVMPLGSTAVTALADGTSYTAEGMEMTKKLEVIPGMPGKTVTIYLELMGRAFDAEADFFTELMFSLSETPDDGSPFAGDVYDTYSIVYEMVNDVGPVEVVDYSGPPGAGQFDKQSLNLGTPNAANPQYGVWVTNSSSLESLALSVPSHPLLTLPGLSEVAFDDLPQRGGTIAAAGSGGSLATVGYVAPFMRCGPGLPGFADCSPLLVGRGPLLPATPLAFDISKGRPLAMLAFVIGVADLSAPFKGGVLKPTPDVILTGLPLDAQGELTIPTVWPPGLPSGLALYEQAWIADSAAIFGYSATNGLRSESP
ncbi:MAG: hypothetical protein H6825_14735 [Planctomycetes bacterium]|nr:hypothetical protein [Planctomycetota bacterium]